jgi:hypothetical protein
LFVDGLPGISGFERSSMQQSELEKLLRGKIGPGLSRHGGSFGRGRGEARGSVREGGIERCLGEDMRQLGGEMTGLRMRSPIGRRQGDRESVETDAAWTNSPAEFRTNSGVV